MREIVRRGELPMMLSIPLIVLLIGILAVLFLPRIFAVIGRKPILSDGDRQNSIVSANSDLEKQSVMNEVQRRLNAASSARTIRARHNIYDPPESFIVTKAHFPNSVRQDNTWCGRLRTILADTSLAYHLRGLCACIDCDEIRFSLFGDESDSAALLSGAYDIDCSMLYLSLTSDTYLMIPITEGDAMKRHMQRGIRK